jgi:hypothetical protein
MRLCVGTTNDDVSDITNLGFQIKNALKILGMSVSNNLGDDTEKAVRQITSKILDNITKWERFNLSLPGRILIAKSMLYSQLNYLGCFLDIPKAAYDNWENLIFRYTAGNLNIGKNRVFAPVEIGGLGLFNIETFLGAQKIRWILYANKKIDAQ